MPNRFVRIVIAWCVLYLYVVSLLLLLRQETTISLLILLFFFCGLGVLGMFILNRLRLRTAITPVPFRKLTEWLSW